MHQLFRRILIGLLFLTSISATSAFAADVTVTVVDGGSNPFAGIKVYAYTESGTYTGKYALTDAYGVALLGADTDFSAGSHKFRIDYLGHQFWTDPITLPDTTAITYTIILESTEVSVYTSTGPADNIRVYLFSSAESYLSDYDYTGTDGKVLFSLPVSGSFKFRADMTGHQYWSDVIQIVQGGPNLVDIDAGGGLFRIIVGEDINTPMPGIRSYLFMDNGSYLSQYADTDASGVVEFNVPEGSYMVRADYLGYQFYTNVTFVNADTEINHLIPHQDAIITVNSQFQGETPMENVNVYLFTGAGSYMNQVQPTDVNGHVTFHLPDKEYKIRADYLGKQFWSDSFLPQDFSLNIPMADAEIYVGWGEFGLENIPVYVFSTTGSYTNVNGTTDVSGKITFRLPADTWRFRADYQNNQYWSLDSTLTAELVNPVEIQTGGGTFSFTVLKGDSDPLEGVNCYVFGEDDTYFGVYGPSSSSGLVTFDLAAGSYKMRVDHLGYQFWSEIYNVPDVLSDTFTILHTDVTITVNGVFDTPVPLENIPIYLFTASGSYMSRQQTTDQNGQVAFNLPETSYKIRADYMGMQFWSNEFTAQDTSVDIPMADAEITVTGEGLPVEGVPVYVFSETGAYLNLTQDTDAQGKVTFHLPAGNFKFRADYNANQYWSDVETLSAGIVNPIAIEAGGGYFSLTVMRDTQDPLVGAVCYVFNDSGAYLNISATTDANGQVFFELTEGCYKIRVNHLGYQFWTDVYTVPDTLSDIFLIQHQNVQITVNGVFQTSDPLEGLSVYLFTESGAYMNQVLQTDTNGNVSFYLPATSYKVRVDYRSQQFWSQPFTQQDAVVDIPMADAEITVTGGGHIIQGVTVHVFSQTNAYLNVLGTTDENGKVLFRLPASAYRFRATYQGSQFWNNDQPLTAGQVNPLEIATGGGVFSLTVDKGEFGPLSSVSCYVFTQSNSYLGISGTTDDNGLITFDLADGDYRIRVDYLGYKFWAPDYTIPDIFSDVYTIPHNAVPVYVQGLNPGPSPLDGISVYLFTGSESYMNQNPATDANGRVTFTLPEQDYKVRVTYDGVTYWSDILTPDGAIIAINLGTTDILPAVSDFTASEAGPGQVGITWTPLGDTSPLVLAGYNLYRRHESQDQAVIINDTLLDPTASSYTDMDVMVSGTYYYYLSGVTDSSIEGYPSLVKAVVIEETIPENTTPVTGISAVWEDDDAKLTWNDLDGYKFQIYRGSSEAGITALEQTDTIPWYDLEAEYYYTWYYRIATIKEYTDAGSGTTIQKIGPQSSVIVLSGQPRPVVDIVGADEDPTSNTFTKVFGSDQPYIFNGSYDYMSDNILITATNGTDTVTGSGADGEFSIQLTGGGTWQVTLSEDGGERSTTFDVTIVIDDTPPDLTVDGGDAQTVTQDLMTITGTVSDSASGVLEVRVETNGQAYGAVLEDLGGFTCQVPLSAGQNTLSVIAVDNAGNTTQKDILVTLELTQLPILTITAPTNGAIVDTPGITLSGVVRSTLLPDDIRLVFDNRILFPQGTNNEYTFTYDNITLIEGPNTLIVTAETIHGNVTAQVVVTYQPQGQGEEQNPPVIEINAPRFPVYVTGDVVEVSGAVTGEQDIQSIDVNSEPAAFTGSGTYVSFSHVLSFPDGVDTLDITVTATDSTNLSSTLTYQAIRDNTPPVITITTSGILPDPTVNSVNQTPFTLEGTVADANFAGLSINSVNVGVLPAGADNTWSFSAALALERGVDTPLLIEAWDNAGLPSEYALILRLDTTLDILMISPKANDQLTADGDFLDVEVSVNVPGIGDTDEVTVIADSQAPITLTKSGQSAQGIVTVDAHVESHVLAISVKNGATILAQTTTPFTVINLADIPLSLTRTEPENDAVDIEPNEFIAFYFNRAIDPLKISVTVKETVHGKDYKKQEKGADITQLSDITLIDVDRDGEDVTGGVSLFPGNTMAAFYPSQDFAYGAKIFVEVSYDSATLSRFSFTIRDLPTLIQGVVTDQMAVPVQGLEVEIPEIDRKTTTNSDGVFDFGFGESADKHIPGSRYQVVVNTDLKNRTYGTVKIWAMVDDGRLNNLGVIKVPALNTSEPFRSIESGQAQAILSAGDLTLDLTNADLLFPDGKDYGDVHVQFMGFEQISYSYLFSAIPKWLYAVQPMGIKVSGEVGVSFKLPLLNDTHDYVQYLADLVLLLGIDPDALMVVPIGVGRVDKVNNTITSEGPLELQQLDFIGYCPVHIDLQTTLEDYVAGEATMNDIMTFLANE